MRNFFKIIFFIVIFGVFVFFMMRRNEINSAVFDPIRSFFNPPASLEEITTLKLENQALLNEIMMLKGTVENVPDYHYKTAAVYSRYPLNDRSLIIISAGAEDGIVPGMPVMVREGILLGKVKSVSRTQSEVETIFSPRWKSSVSIGNTRAKAVLQGGATPSLELISKEESVREGEGVSNISPEFPLYTSLGTLESLRSPSNDVWQYGVLGLSYSIQDITSVFVLIDFP